MRKLMNDSTVDETDAIVPFLADGVTAPKGDFSFIVSIRRFSTSEHLCGGVLVAPNLVLTAAHCVDPSLPRSEPFPVCHIGSRFITKNDGEIRFACKVIFHENWNGKITDGYDLVLLVLDESSTIDPVPIDTEPLKLGQSTVALGWGRTEDDSRVEELQINEELDVITNDQCNSPQAFEGIIKENMVCAGGGKGGVCAGDSGGPLLKVDPPRLVGLTSFGRGGMCGKTTLPEVFTRIESFSEWVRSIGDGESRQFLVDDLSFTDSIRKECLATLDSEIDQDVEFVDQHSMAPPIASLQTDEVVEEVDPVDEVLLLLLDGDTEEVGESLGTIAEDANAVTMLESFAERAVDQNLTAAASDALITTWQRLPLELRTVARRSLEVFSREICVEDLSQKIVIGDKEGAAKDIARASKVDAPCIYEGVKRAIDTGAIENAADSLVEATKQGMDANMTALTESLMMVQKELFGT